MHFLAFAFKRAHYASLRTSRGYAARFGLTPARFDMLYVVKECHGRSQAWIARMLGLSGVTVSRMLRVLAALGLVERSRSRRDRRKLTARLTRKGRHRLFGVLSILKSRVLQRAFEHAFVERRTPRTFFALDGFAHRVVHLQLELSQFKRRALRDQLQYPTWHPDD
ncbi:MAG TPA: MarR family transcriptional regulator [Polyangiaceae bacterium]